MGCSNDEAASAIADRISDHRGLAVRLPVLATPDQRDAILALNPQVQLHADRVSIKLGDEVTVTRETKLVRKGMDLRLTLPPEGSSPHPDPDPVLLKLVAHATAAKQLMVDGGAAPTVAHYSKRHLWQLLRISWLAPHILAAIVNGAQPIELTGAVC